MVTIQGFHSSVLESWVEDGEAGGHFFLLLCVSHKAYTEQGDNHLLEGEEGLSLYHEPIIVADTQGRYINLTTNANVTFPSFHMEIGLSNRKSCGCWVRHRSFPWSYRGACEQNESHHDLNLHSSSINNPGAKVITWCRVTTWLFCFIVFTVREKTHPTTNTYMLSIKDVA